MTSTKVTRSLLLLSLAAVFSFCEQDTSFSCNDRGQVKSDLVKATGKIILVDNNVAFTPDPLPNSPVAIEGQPIYFLCFSGQLPEAGSSVVISGSVFEVNYSPHMQIAGKEYLIIDVSFIEKSSND